MIFILILCFSFCLFISWKSNEIIDSKEKTIERMKVWQKNQEDREKQLLERIKFLESNQK